MNQSEKLAPSGNIPYDVLMNLANRYSGHKHRLLSADLGSKPETKEVWFELNQQMRDFLTEVLTDKDVSGIRMYLMEYPSQQTIIHGVTIPIDPNDVSQLTIGMVTTKAGDGTGRRHEDYPETKSGIKMLLAPPMNHGELCPQKCD
jgi:hypothetical protein